MNGSQRFRLDVSMLAKIAWIFIFVVQRHLDLEIKMQKESFMSTPFGKFELSKRYTQQLPFEEILRGGHTKN